MRGESDGDRTGTASVRVDVLDAEGRALIAHARLRLGAAPTSADGERGLIEADARFGVTPGLHVIRLPDGVAWRVALRAGSGRRLSVFSAEAPDLSRLGGE